MNLTYDGIIERYFAGVHASFPILSPDSLRHEASQYREGRPPPADSTVLLLAILLIISPPLDHSRHGITQEFLYTTTKAAFSQAQASMTTSLRLLQAAVLITLREYTCARVDAAYISMMTCAGMARVSGITATTIGTPMCLDQQVGQRERENVAWAIAMLERYV